MMMQIQGLIFLLFIYICTLCLPKYMRIYVLSFM